MVRKVGRQQTGYVLSLGQAIAQTFVSSRKVSVVSPYVGRLGVIHVIGLGWLIEGNASRRHQDQSTQHRLGSCILVFIIELQGTLVGCLSRCICSSFTTSQVVNLPPAQHGTVDNGFQSAFLQAQNQKIHLAGSDMPNPTRDHTYRPVCVEQHACSSGQLVNCVIC